MRNTSRSKSSGKKLGVVLLSGGLDSTTLATLAQVQGFDLLALTVYYGQRNKKEIEAAKKVARILSIEHKTFELPQFGELAWHSALTRKDFVVSRGEKTNMSLTYVPLRNTFFISLAASLLESEALSLIEGEGFAPGDLETKVFISANVVDYSGYPDCRPEYFAKLSQALKLGSKLYMEYKVPFKVETPLIFKSKAEIVRLGIELGAPLEYTWSCYKEGEIPCGICDSCKLRSKGFAEAGLEDPLLKRLKEEGKLAGK